MGRNSTGAVTTGAALRIELSYLLKAGIIKKGCKIQTDITWTSGAIIKIEANYHNQARYNIRLIYRTTDREGNKTDHDYKIYLDEVLSNLGKGYVLYFLCPVSGDRCRVLYMCYGSDIFKARASYQNRIYYSCQVSSKYGYPNDRYHSLEKQIESLRKSKRKQLTYKGQPTRFALRLKRLKHEKDKYNEISDYFLTYMLYKSTLSNYEFNRIMKMALR